VKKRCPPISKRQPSAVAVRLIPPTTVSDSSTVLCTPRLFRTYAAVRPAGPAPMITILWSAVIDGACPFTTAGVDLAEA